MGAKQFWNYRTAEIVLGKTERERNGFLVVVIVRFLTDRQFLLGTTERFGSSGVLKTGFIFQTFAVDRYE